MDAPTTKPAFYVEFVFHIPAETEHAMFEAFANNMLGSFSQFEGIVTDVDGGLNYKTGEFTISLCVQGLVNLANLIQHVEADEVVVRPVEHE